MLGWSKSSGCQKLVNSRYPVLAQPIAVGEVLVVGIVAVDLGCGRPRVHGGGEDGGERQQPVLTPPRVVAVLAARPCGLDERRDADHAVDAHALDERDRERGIELSPRRPVRQPVELVGRDAVLHGGPDVLGQLVGGGDGRVAVGVAHVAQPEDRLVPHRQHHRVELFLAQRALAEVLVGLEEGVGDVACELVEVVPVADEVGQRGIRLAKARQVRRAAAAQAGELAGHGVRLGLQRGDEREPVAGIAAELEGIGAAGGHQRASAQTGMLRPERRVVDAGGSGSSAAWL